jgi:hypothetical protein
MLGLRSHSRGLGVSPRRSRRTGARPLDVVVANGVASEVTFGAPTVEAMAELLVANGIASGLTFGAPAVAAMAELAVADGIASGLTFGAPTVAAMAELAVAAGIPSGLTFGSPTIATAPSIRTQSIQGRSAADPHNVPTSGFGWVSGDLVLAFTGMSGTITLSSLTGLTDDTYTQLVSVLPGSHAHRQYLHRGAVNGGAFDSTTRWDLSGSRAIVLALLSIIGGHATLDASHQLRNRRRPTLGPGHHDHRPEPADHCRGDHPRCTRDQSAERPFGLHSARQRLYGQQQPQRNRAKHYLCRLQRADSRRYGCRGILGRSQQHRFPALGNHPHRGQVRLAPSGQDGRHPRSARDLQTQLGLGGSLRAPALRGVISQWPTRFSRSSKNMR